MMKFSFLSLFPHLIESYFADSILKRGRANGLIEIQTINIRDYAFDAYQKVDDTPMSGGAGQVMKADVLSRALDEVRDSHIIFLSPCGKVFNHNDSMRLAQKSHISFVCGRYRGFDERVIEHYADEILSIGDFVLTGGELPALVLCDSISRHIAGVLGNADSLKGESFENFLLESPAFTKITENSNFLPPPSEYSKGNHGKIAELKRSLAICKTKYFRPDLYQAYCRIVKTQPKRKGKR